MEGRAPARGPARPAATARGGVPSTSEAGSRGAVRWRQVQVRWPRRTRAGASACQRTRDGPRRGGLRRAIVEAECRGEGRGDLALGDRSNAAALAQRRRVGAEDGDPDILGTVHLLAVIGPVIPRAAAAVIGG